MPKGGRGGVGKTTETEFFDDARRRRLAATLYCPEVARLIIVGEAPPPERFFFYGDSLFLRYLRRAFAPLAPEADTRGTDWFLAYFRALGGWRTDVCETPQRGTKGGADDVSDCMEGFLRRWRAQPRDREALLIVSPKRLVAALPDEVRSVGAFGVPPPGQWNAHRQAFQREVGTLLERYVGRDELRRIAGTVDPDDAALDFEIARACAEGADADEIRRLLKGHPREAALRAAWEAKGSRDGDDDGDFGRAAGAGTAYDHRSGG